MKQTIFTYKGENIIKLSSTEYRVLGHTYCSISAAQGHIDRVKVNWQPLSSLDAQFSMN
jgi:hypothetical protein